MNRILKIAFISLLLFTATTPQVVLSQLFIMEVENANLGKPAPDFTLMTTDGTQTNFTEYRNGRKAIIYFWATWCPDCLEKLTYFNQKSEQYLNKGIVLVVIDVGEKPEAVQKYLKKNNISLKVFLDEKSTLMDPYGVFSVPTIFFVNEKGIVRDVLNEMPKDVEAVFGG